MQPHIMLWSTILGYIFIAFTISVITTVWMRHHFRKVQNGTYCKVLTRGAYCTLNERQRIVDLVQ